MCTILISNSKSKITQKVLIEHSSILATRRTITYCCQYTTIFHLDIPYLPDAETGYFGN